jgi:hypothetical protein
MSRRSPRLRAFRKYFQPFVMQTFDYAMPAAALPAASWPTAHRQRQAQRPAAQAGGEPDSRINIRRLGKLLKSNTFNWRFETEPSRPRTTRAALTPINGMICARPAWRRDRAEAGAHGGRERHRAPFVTGTTPPATRPRQGRPLSWEVRALTSPRPSRGARQDDRS